MIFLFPSRRRPPSVARIDVAQDLSEHSSGTAGIGETCQWEARQRTWRGENSHQHMANKRSLKATLGTLPEWAKVGDEAGS